jgi:hypothetical protein
VVASYFPEKLSSSAGFSVSHTICHYVEIGNIEKNGKKN